MNLDEATIGADGNGNVNGNGPTDEAAAAAAAPPPLESALGGHSHDPHYGCSYNYYNYYYYQNPRTGTASASPLSLGQLVRLFCPVRDGRDAILPPSTQCLAVAVHVQQQQHAVRGPTDDDADNDAASNAGTTFGEWKPASQIDVLREACCTEWFWTERGQQQPATAETTETETTAKAAHGPCSARRLFDLHRERSSRGLLVYAKDVTAEWTEASRLPHLQLVFEALEDVVPNAGGDRGGPATAVPTSEGLVADPTGEEDSQRIQDELEAFLSSTGGNGTAAGGGNGNPRGADDEDDDDDDHSYESDAGTRYVRDPNTGNWIHEALAPPEASKGRTSNENNINNNSTNATNQSRTKPGQQTSSSSKGTQRKKSKKAKFAKRNAKHWVYVSGLPTGGSDGDVTLEDVQKYFSKAGMLDLDPETLQPKIKLYRNPETGRPKGDASVCYARPESVELALNVLDDSPWDARHRIRVERAHFEAKDDDAEEGRDGAERASTDQTTTAGPAQGSDAAGRRKRGRPAVSEAQRKVVRLAILQAQDEGFGERLAGGRKGLRIIVVKGMMGGIADEELEGVLFEACQGYGAIEKITCVSKTDVVIVKFVEPVAASEALNSLNGSANPRTGEKMKAIFWDGVTDYTKMQGDDEKEREDEDQRHDKFGSWLESQVDLPPELRLQVASEET